MQLFRYARDRFVQAYVFLCGGAVYTPGSNESWFLHRWRQFMALIVLCMPFFALGWAVEPFVTKYTRVFFTAYCVGVLFFIASVDRHAFHIAKRQEKSDGLGSG